MRRATLYKYFNKARDDVGAKHVTPHNLRRAAGTLAAWTGATLMELMERLGHSSAQAAMRYQQAAKDRDQTIAERLNVVIQNVNRTPLEPVGDLVR